MVVLMDLCPPARLLWWTKMMKLLGQNCQTFARGKEKLWDVVLCTPAFMAFVSRTDLWSPAGLQEMRSFGCWQGSCLCCAAVQGLSGAATCSSLPLPAKPPRLEPAAHPSHLPGLLFKAGHWAVILGRSPEQKPAVTSCVSSAGVTWLKMDGHPVAWAFLLREEAVEEESMSRNKTREFSDFALFYFGVCKLHGFAGQIQMLNSCLAQKRLGLWGCTCSGVNRAQLGKLLRMPFCVAAVSLGDQVACGWAGGCCTDSKSQEGAQGVVMLLATSSEGGQSRSCRLLSCQWGSSLGQWPWSTVLVYTALVIPSFSILWPHQELQLVILV